MSKEKMSFRDWINKDGFRSDCSKRIEDFIADKFDKYQAYLSEPDTISLKWEDIINKGLNEGDSSYVINIMAEIRKTQPVKTTMLKCLRSTLPTKESAERQLASCQWEMIAFAANGGKVLIKGYSVHRFMNEVRPFLAEWDDANIKFKTIELCEQAYEENKDVVHTMLRIK